LTEAIPGPPGEFAPGSQIAGYLLQDQIGQGGMAVVFRAHDQRLDRTVALKILSPALAEDDVFRQRFIRESRAAAAVDDPYIIPVFEAGEASGVLFIASRFVAGGDVRSLVARYGPMQPSRAAEIISQVASALDAAHGRGLVHRDVKPANILLDGSSGAGRPDHVYLCDFGLSKGSLQASGLTGTGIFLGTLDYIAPEQIEGKLVDGRADQYALACTAFEMLTGAPPFPRQEAIAVMYAQLSESPPALSSCRPGSPPSADLVFARALAKSPADRYGSCRAFAEALRAAFGLRPFDSGAGEVPSRTQRVAETAADAGALPGLSGGGRDAPTALPGGGRDAAMAYPGAGRNGAGQAGYPGQAGYEGQAGYPGQAGYQAQGGYPGQGGSPGQAGYPGQGARGQGAYPGQGGQGQGRYPGQGGPAQGGYSPPGGPGPVGYPTQGVGDPTQGPWPGGGSGTSGSGASGSGASGSGASGSGDYAYTGPGDGSRRRRAVLATVAAAAVVIVGGLGGYALVSGKLFGSGDNNVVGRHHHGSQGTQGTHRTQGTHGTNGTQGNQGTQSAHALLKPPECVRTAATGTKLPGVPAVKVPGDTGQPFGIAVSSDGRAVFVVTDGAVKVYRASGETLTDSGVSYPVGSLTQKATVAVVTTDGRYLLVATDNGVKVLDATAAEKGDQNAVVGSLQVPGLTKYGRPIGVAVTPDGKFVFVSLQFRDEVGVFNLGKAIHEQFDPSGDYFVGSLNVGAQPVGLAMSHDGTTLYATAFLGNSAVPGTLSVVDVVKATDSDQIGHAVISKVKTGCFPARIAVSQDDSTVWVTARESNFLLGYSAAALRDHPDRALVAEVHVGFQPIDVALVNDGKRIVVSDDNNVATPPDDGNLAVVDTDAALARKQALLGYVPSAETPHEMALSPDGRLLYVTNYDGAQIQIINTANLP